MNFQLMQKAKFLWQDALDNLQADILKRFNAVEERLRNLEAIAKELDDRILVLEPNPGGYWRYLVDNKPPAAPEEERCECGHIWVNHLPIEEGGYCAWKECECLRANPRPSFFQPPAAPAKECCGRLEFRDLHQDDCPNASPPAASGPSEYATRDGEVGPFPASPRGLPADKPLTNGGNNPATTLFCNLGVRGCHTLHTRDSEHIYEPPPAASENLGPCYHGVSGGCLEDTEQQPAPPRQAQWLVAFPGCEHTGGHTTIELTPAVQAALELRGRIEAEIDGMRDDAHIGVGEIRSILVAPEKS